MGDIHPLGNPHYWIPPKNARGIARLLARRFSELDAAGVADALVPDDPGLVVDVTTMNQVAAAAVAAFGASGLAAGSSGEGAKVV